MPLQTYGALPGMTSASYTVERTVWWGREERNLLLENAPIDSTAVDAGNSPTTELRAGLALGKKTSDGLLYQWDATATDGTEVLAGILLRDISMLNADSVVEDKLAHVLVAGALKAGDIYIKGTLLTSSNDEFMFRRQACGTGRFILDDDLPCGSAYLGVPLKQKYITASETLTTAQNGTKFIVAGSGAVTLTLPTIKAGLVYELFNTADQNVAFTAGSAIMIGDGNAAFTSATASTASHKIGAHFRVEAIYVNTTLKWAFTNLNVGVTATFA